MIVVEEGMLEIIISPPIDHGQTLLVGRQSLQEILDNLRSD